MATNGVKISSFTELGSLLGSEKIPTGTGNRKATTPAQLRSYTLTTEQKSVSIATGTIANQSIATGDFAISRLHQIVAISSNVSARVRLYKTQSGRDADISRPVTQDHAENIPLVFEYVTDAPSLLSADLARDVTSSCNGTLYYAVTNLSGVSAALAVVIGYFERGY